MVHVVLPHSIIIQLYTINTYAISVCDNACNSLLLHQHRARQILITCPHVWHGSCLLHDGHIANRSRGMTLGEWTNPVLTVAPYTGSQKGRQEAEAEMLIHSSQCVVTMGMSSYHPWHLHWSNLPISSWQQHHKPINSIRTFDNTMQPLRSHCLGLRWIVVLTRAEADLQHSRSTASSVTSSVLSFHVVRICDPTTQSHSRAEPEDPVCSPYLPLLRLRPVSALLPTGGRGGVTQGVN